MPLSGQKLKMGSQGDEVKLLHTYLQQLGYGDTIPPEERNAASFGEDTAQAVANFQAKNRLQPTGEVDPETARAINSLIERLHPQPEPEPEAKSEQLRLVGGQVQREDKQPVSNIAVKAFHVDQEVTLRLGEDTTGVDGRYTIRYASLPGLDKVHLRVTAFDENNQILCESQVIPNAQPLEIVDLLVPSVETTTFQVKGKVASRTSAGVGNLRVEIVTKTVGDDSVLATTSTDESGSYQVTFSYTDTRQKCPSLPDLQARVYADNTFLAASDVRYNASSQETLNVLLDEKVSAALQSEYEVLTTALSCYVKGTLGDLQENDARQDITYLANKTGWDARAVALAALADQFSARTADANGARAIPQAFFYALFRAGLPTNEDTLYHTDARTLEAVWKQAIEQGVIPKASANQIPSLVKRFQALSAQKLLTDPALIGTSSLKEMLTVSRLDEAQQHKFAQLYAENRADMPSFWQAVGDAFGQEVAKRLQVDGKLGFLTINNAPLMQKVHTKAGENGLSDPLQLAQMGYHQAEPWSKLLTTDIPIPKEIPGDMPEAKQANYAKYLAAQVRLSYPTAAVAQMVKSGMLPLPGTAKGVSDQVHAFLTEHQGKFEIGVQPVEQYVRNKVKVPDETIQQVKRLQRVYQITASDEAMIGLLNCGIDAAYHVVCYDKDTFIQSFKAKLGGKDQAALTYDKSVQIHNTILNIALSYLNARTAPAIGVHSPPSVLDPTPANTGDIIAYATLESLFGSMDFCACDHCRSILSPAAYLVDLLLFLQSDPEVWTIFLKTWKLNHANAPYPFVDQNAWEKFQKDWNSQHPGQALPSTEISPFNVLMSRRPDIEHLPLTCENTNTALPYIDVVNETLEYYVANSGKPLPLEYYTGHDTGDLASEDLLASPQFVVDSAYTTLRAERFPAPLPFHQPLENLRRYFNKFEVPLSLAMERLRKADDLERGDYPYGWRDILMEEVGLSREEYEILTDSNAVPLRRMYGFPNEAADAGIIANLSNAKQFARRIGITYEDLVSVLKTQFINPNSDLIPKLERLGVSFATLKALKDGTISDDAFNDLLPTGLTAPDPADYGGDIKAWIKNEANYTRIMGLITLAIPAWVASKDYAKGDCVQPMAAQSASTLYYECTTSGTSAAAEPRWPTTPENTYSDGTVVWTCRDVSSCLSFDNLAFHYADPAQLAQNIGGVEFIRLLRFIRLWKKLGWTIEQTDAAICALFRADMNPLSAGDIDTVKKLDAGFLTLLPRLGVVFRVMKVLNLTRKCDLLPLFACWSDIGTHGDTALYRQMFLNPALLKQDTVFADNGYGEFLQYVDVPYVHPQATLEQPIVVAAGGKIGYNDSTKRLSYAGVMDAATRDALQAVPGVSHDFQQAVEGLYRAQRLATHAEALRAAFNLTGDEYDQIVAALSDDANTPLTIPNISAIFRRGWLARKLKLSVRELLLLIQLTGLDPFAAPDPTNPAILRLISLIQALKDRSLKSAAALYLIWNQDLSGMSAPGPAQVAAFARTLRLGFAAIEAEFAVADDPDGTIAQAQVAKVYGADAAAFFFGLLNDTLTVEVEFSDPDGTLAPGAVQQAIENAAGKTDAGVPKIVVDDFRKRLSYSGVLTAATQDAIKQAAGERAVAFKTAVDNLYNKNQAVISPFFARYPELQPLYIAYVNDMNSVTEKRSNLLNQILPDLAKRLKRQQALQSASAIANIDLAFTQAILDPPATPFPLHAAGHSDQPALNDFLALETPGLSVQFFYRDTATGAIDLSVPTRANLDYSARGRNPLPPNPTPGNAISGVWRGYIEAPENGFFNLYFEADAGATVTLILDDRPVTLTQNATLWNSRDPIELRAGTLYAINLTVEKVRNVVRVQWDWQPQGQGRAVIPARYLYPAVSFEAFKEAYVRFLKAASLATGLGLTGNEMAYFATHTDYRINVQGQIDSNGQDWLNVLPNADNLHLTNQADATVAKSLNAALLTPLRALLDFARIKAGLSPNDERLLTILKDPGAATQNTDSPLFTITRWNQTSLNDVLAQFSGNIEGLGQFDLFRRVYDAFALIQKIGISAKALIQATTNDPTGNTVRDLQAALRARYDAAAWRDVVRPINDEMRSLQRDALVAYILEQMRSHPESVHIDTADKLFEYFLMDVQMDPCMQTSRIRHALSSVQLFIERCLMNLEPRVSPAAINAQQWVWMKRYRVWEANRKVYLFPENWLEPELRDDKSPIFKEIESELLQSDITEDSAATALLNYLSKLEEVAKLEPCGMYYIPADPAKRTDEINHVVARTAGARRTYYYRRYESGYWTPWEQIKLDIEDNPVIPVVWNDRLFLFWLRILPQGSDSVQPPFSTGGARPLTSFTTNDINTHPPQVTMKAVLCWSEYYNGKWQATKTSDVNNPVLLGSFSPLAFDRSTLMLWSDEPQDGQLRISIQGTRPAFLLYNTHSLPLQQEYREDGHSLYVMRLPIRSLDTSTDTFTISYNTSLFTEEPPRAILHNTLPYSIIEPLPNSWEAPFFFEDRQNVFYVTSEPHPVWVAGSEDYGVSVNLGAMIVPLIAPLDFLYQEPRRKPWGDGGPIGPFIGPAATLGHVTEDANIRNVIDTTRMVRYGERQIGLAGAIMNAQAGR